MSQPADRPASPSNGMRRSLGFAASAEERASRIEAWRQHLRATHHEAHVPEWNRSFRAPVQREDLSEPLG
ncbi:hypothetical protein [Roseococcus sp. YIM B11640]|uniref:hypothetical protein n=1 Tax=Roseococcus sp. YIM B11640 TaxID=3133973 RepID=UPI003C7D78B1